MWVKNLNTWAKIVKKKNSGRCIYCGAPAEDAHHLFPKSVIPQLALLVEVGVPACQRCHAHIPHYKTSEAYILESYRIRLGELLISSGVTLSNLPKKKPVVLTEIQEDGIPFGLLLVYLQDPGGKQKWRRQLRERIMVQPSGSLEMNTLYSQKDETFLRALLKRK